MMSAKTKSDSINNYFYQEERRATYKKWIFNDNALCSADKMAEAGFIFTGSLREPDAVACFFCHKHLDGWEATDDPWKEHLNHSKHCEFAKMQTAQENWTLEQWFDLQYKYDENAIRKQCEDAKEDIKKYFNKLRKSYSSAL
ncbi:baculoviral IAP repeat containing deterin [Rhynchophorus ferrugineus]|uniref:baculoviral IAP repeat containing deterin n=1 Tax=Rhynchophorus ferrugineus TaxID=354439 RepID=UPI003FCC545B